VGGEVKMSAFVPFGSYGEIDFACPSMRSMLGMVGEQSEPT